MTRRSFLLYAKPGMAAEYHRRHQQIWPEMVEALKTHGARNYSIYLHEPSGALFGYLEVEDEVAFNKIGETEVCQRWWRYMKEVLVEAGPDSPMAKEEILKEVFHLD